MEGKRILSFILAVVILFLNVSCIIPSKIVLAAEEDSSKDAFGISMDATIDEEKEKKNNPYGTENWFTLFEVSELMMTYGHSDTRYTKVYDFGGTDGTVGSIGSVTNGTLIGDNTVGNMDNNGFRLMDTYGIDPFGDGNKNYVVSFGYYEDQENLQMWITDKAGNRGPLWEYSGSNGNGFEYLDEADGYENTMQISVVAGDFDGDGKDTIVAYLPEMGDKNAPPRIEEYEVASNKEISFSKRSLTKNIYTTLGLDNYSETRSKESRVFRNVPNVHMTVADLDRDGMDEVVVTAGFANTYDGDISKQQTQILIYDYIIDNDPNIEDNQGEWHLTKSFDTTSSTYNGRLRYSSSSVGNVTQNNGVDFPEIVTAGWVDTSSDDEDDITHDVGVMITTCSGVTMQNGTPVGNYTSSAIGKAEVGSWTTGGHYSNDNVQPYVPVQTFAARGVTSAEYILISDTVFEYNGSKIEKKHRNTYFDSRDRGIGDSIISNAAVVDAAAGNFDGNTEGKEQVVFVTMLKREVRNDYFYKVYTYQINEDGDWQTDSTGWLIDKIGYPYFSITTFDCDKDSTIARIKDVELSYTEPEVLAILEATPNFEELDGGDIGNSETYYGKTEGSGTGSSSSDSLTTNMVAGFEYEISDATAGFVCGFGFEASVEMGWTWENAESQMSEFTINYSNDTDENKVIVYRRPVISYLYELKDSKNTVILAKEGNLATSMITVDEYNLIAPQYNMTIIPEGMLATPGKPNTYRSTTTGLKNVVLSSEKTQYSSNGTITQEFANSTENESSFTYNLDTSFTAYGSVMGAKAGGGAGYSTSETTSTLKTTAITKGGAVTGKQVDGYDFQWQFAHWTTEVNGNTIPVLGYIVTDIIAPPSPPQDLMVEDVTDTEATLKWNAGDRAADEYRIYRVASDGTEFYVATVDGSKTSEKLTNLEPNTTYTYKMTGFSAIAESNGEGFGESVFSEEVVFTTFPSNVEPIYIKDPENISVNAGENALFKIEVLPPDGYASIKCQWEVDVGNNEWASINKEDSETLVLQGVTADMNGYKYRCHVSALYNTTAVHSYTKPATLTVGKTSLSLVVNVLNSLGGVGTINDPYTGLSNYQQKNVDVEYEEKIVNVEVIKDNEKYTIYCQDANSELYFARNSSGNWFAVTKNGESYDIGDEIVETINIKYIGIDGNEIETSLINEIDNAQFNFDAPIMLTIENELYEKTRKLSGTKSNDTIYLDNITSVGNIYLKNNDNVFEYINDTTKGKEATENVSNLYEIYAESGDNEFYIFGKNEQVFDISGDIENEEYWYYLVKISKDNNQEVYTVVPFKVLEEKGYSVSNFDKSKNEVLTKKTLEEKQIFSYEDKSGTMAQINVSVKNSYGDAVTNANVKFNITNLENGALKNITATTDSNGKATVSWTAENAAMYSITCDIIDLKKYVAETSEPVYYEANNTPDEAMTEYKLMLVDGDNIIGESIDFGEGFSLKLQSREVFPTNVGGIWTDVSATDNYKYTVTKPGSNKADALNTTMYNPTLAGIYTFAAYKDDIKDTNLIASVTVQVESIPVVITPVWDNGTTPTQKSEVFFNVEGATISDAVLNAVFEIECAYFYNQDLTGVIDVVIAYKEENEDVRMFKQNYLASLNRNSFTIKANSAVVKYTAGENGTLTGRYTESRLLFESGYSIMQNSKILFSATPNTGYCVDKWIINGTEYEASIFESKGWSVENAPSAEWLILDSFIPTETGHLLNEELKVEVQFRKSSAVVTFDSADTELGYVIAIIDNTESEISTGSNVSTPANIKFTAIASGDNIVDEWLVDGITYKWDTGEKYAEKELTLKDIKDDISVIVKFKENKTHTIETNVTDENGKNSSAASVKILDAFDNEVDLSKIPDGTKINLTATLIDNTVVKEWQISDDGTTWNTLKDSGSKNSVSIAITSNLKIRVVVVSAQNYKINYSILGGDSNINLKVSSKNVSNIQNGDEQPAYTEINFELETNNQEEKYYVYQWSSNVTVAEDNPIKATISSLEEDVNVVITVYELVFEEFENAELTVISSDTDVTDQDLIYQDEDGTEILVKYTPNHGYKIESVKVNNLITDTTFENEQTNDVVVLSFNAIEEDKNIKPNVILLDKNSFKYNVVDVLPEKDGGTNGTLTIDVSRKEMISYETEFDIVSDSISGEQEIYEGSKVIFNSKAEEGYRVKEWTIDNEVLKNSSGEVITASSIVLNANELADKVVTVQFELGDPIITFEVPTNATLTAESAGVQINSGAAVKGNIEFTVSEISENYTIEGWLVNDVLVEENGETFKGNTLLYENNGQNAYVEVLILKIKIPITVKAGVGGTAEISGDSVVRHGDTIILKATANEGYEFDAWYKNNVKIVDASFKYEVVITEEATYEARFTATNNNIVTYEVLDIENQKLDETIAKLEAKVDNRKINSGDVVQGGKKVIFTVNVADGYRVKEWINIPSGAIISEDKSTLTIDSLGGNVDIDVIIEEIPVYSITLITMPENVGTITAKVENEEVTSVREGTEVTFAAVANPNWQFKTWSGDINSTSSTQTLVIEKDTVVYGIFEEAINYKVKYSVTGEGGNITGVTNENTIAKDTEVQIVGGSKLVFTALPNTNKMVKEWVVNGNAIEDNLSNTFVIEYLNQNVVVEVSYEDEILYALPTTNDDYIVKDVTRTPDCYGNNSQIRKDGAVEFTIAPKENKYISEIDIVPSGDGVTIKENSDGSYTIKIENAQQDIVLTTTVIDGIPVVITSMTNGTVEVKKNGNIITNGASVLSGDTLKITSKPNSGYVLNTLKINGNSSNGTYLVTGTEQEINIEATFKSKPSGGSGGGGGGYTASKYEITVKQNDGGKISPETIKVEKGATQTFKINVDEYYVLKDVLVDGESVGAISEYVFENIDEKHSIEAIFEKESWKNPFVDVNVDDWYYEAVRFVNTNGLYEGTTSTTFEPELLMTRGMAITIISRIENSSGEYELEFEDVQEEMYYAKPIAWGHQNGIVKGINEHEFAPEQEITREELVTMLHRYAKYKKIDTEIDGQKIFAYQDYEKISEYALEAICWGIENNIIIGRTENTLAAQETATRAECATIFMRFCEKFTITK